MLVSELGGRDQAKELATAVVVALRDNVSHNNLIIGTHTLSDVEIMARRRNRHNRSRITNGEREAVRGIFTREVSLRRPVRVLVGRYNSTKRLVTINTELGWLEKVIQWELNRLWPEAVVKFESLEPMPVPTTETRGIEQLAQAVSRPYYTRGTTASAIVWDEALPWLVDN